jgi:hypothetical protein
VRLVDAEALTDYRNLFGPRAPSLAAPALEGDRLALTWTENESPADVTFNVYRDGARVADSLPGTTTSWVDPASGTHATTSHCYTVEAVYVGSGNASQHAEPRCYFGPGGERVTSVGAQAFEATGGQLVFNHGQQHYEDWGDPEDALRLEVKPARSGHYLVQALAGNGAGDVSTGVTCGVKALEVWRGDQLVASGQLLVPHLGTWDDWRESTAVPADLEAGVTYSVVIREDASSGNMSDLSHFSLYRFAGGASGRFNKVNIAEVKLFLMAPDE